MNSTAEIVKRGKGKLETFDRDKLHASIVAACLSARTPHGQAVDIADLVCTAVIDWLNERPEVTSRDIRDITTHHLNVHHPDAAYLYEQNKITI